MEIAGLICNPFLEDVTKFPGLFAPGSESYREREGHGANWPESYWPAAKRLRVVRCIQVCLSVSM